MNDMGKPSPSAIELELESEPQMASDLEPVSGSVPYRSTPVFNEVTLPAAMRHGHRTKACVWAVVRLLEGPSETLLHRSTLDRIAVATNTGIDIAGTTAFCRAHRLNAIAD